MDPTDTTDVASTPEELAMVDHVSNLPNALYRHTPTTFHRFRSLPSEIQIRIWEFVAGQPRIILEEKVHLVVRFAEAYEVSPLFGVFPEALNASPKQYLRVLTNEKQWVNFDADIIFLNEDLCGLTIGLRDAMLDFTTWNISNDEKFKLTQRLAVGYTWAFEYLKRTHTREVAGQYIDNLFEKLSRYIHANGDLKEILIVMEQRKCRTHDKDKLRLLSISQVENAGLTPREWAWSFTVPEMRNLEELLQEELDQRLQHEDKQIKVRVVCQFYPPDMSSEYMSRSRSQRLQRFAQLEQQHPFLEDF